MPVRVGEFCKDRWMASQGQRPFIVFTAYSRCRQNVFKARESLDRPGPACAAGLDPAFPIHRLLPSSLLVKTEESWPCIDCPELPFMPPAVCWNPTGRCRSGVLAGQYIPLIRDAAGFCRLHLGLYPLGVRLLSVPPSDNLPLQHS